MVEQPLLGTVTYKATNPTVPVLVYQTFIKQLTNYGSVPNGTEITQCPNTFSDVITTCTLDFDSVTGEDATDTPTMNGTYVFDELQFTVVTTIC